MKNYPKNKARTRRAFGRALVSRNLIFLRGRLEGKNLHDPFLTLVLAERGGFEPPIGYELTDEGDKGGARGMKSIT
jgi:hypothetical protein